MINFSVDKNVVSYTSKSRFQECCLVYFTQIKVNVKQRLFDDYSNSQAEDCSYSNVTTQITYILSLFHPNFSDGSFWSNGKIALGKVNIPFKGEGC